MSSQRTTRSATTSSAASSKEKKSVEIFQCQCEKSFSTKAGLTTHQRSCERSPPTDKPKGKGKEKAHTNESEAEDHPRKRQKTVVVKQQQQQQQQPWSLTSLPEDPTRLSLLGASYFSSTHPAPETGHLVPKESSPGHHLPQRTVYFRDPSVSVSSSSGRQPLSGSSEKGEVVLISGGGAGHEPSHAGFVGPGMLAAAVSGKVFASPSPLQILRAIEEACAERQTQFDREEGAASVPVKALLVVKNYTGDRLNFATAAERARAKGIEVATVTVGDDSALPSEKKSAGRRGLAGTLLVHKIAGAVADQQRPLEEVVKVAEWVVAHLVTVGVARRDSSGELEIGLGIHGEPGFKSLPTRVLPPAEVIGEVLDLLLPKEGGYLHPAPQRGDEVAVLVNNLGGVSCLEMGVLAQEAVCQLVNQRGLKVRRGYLGTLMTSKNMLGLSISVLHLKDSPEDLVRLLDHPVRVSAWPTTCFNGDDADSLKEGLSRAQPAKSPAKDLAVGGETPQPPAGIFYECITNMMQALVDAESSLTAYDQQVGDGDCGITIKEGATAVLSRARQIAGLSPGKAFSALSDAIMDNMMGGSSGWLYGYFLEVLGRSLGEKPLAEVELGDWSTALKEATEALAQKGGAAKGDRTMLDALFPASEVLEGFASQPRVGKDSEFFAEVLTRLKEAAAQGAEGTRNMKAGAGRSSYISEEKLTVPDPGAFAVSVWIGALCDTLKSHYSKAE